MITIEKEQPAGIPTLHIVKQELRDTELPTVMFVHGFTSAKEHNLHYAYYLAQEGMRVLLPEALYHGERNDGTKEEQLTFSFWKIVIQTIHELEMIKTEYVQKGMISEGQIGLVGTSMGGIVTLGALTQYEWVDAAVSLMGNPSYEGFARWQIDNIKKSGVPIHLNEEEIEAQMQQLAPYDLSNQFEKVRNTPLLFWHGKVDSVVPYDHAYEFYYSLQQDYPDAVTSFITDENAGHKVSREGVIATVEWFKHHLLKAKIEEKLG